MEGLMRIDDLVLAITVSTLNSQSELESTIRTMREKFTNLDFDEPRKAQMISVGSIEPEGQVTGLGTWLQKQRSFGATRASAVMISPEQLQGLPEPMRSALSSGNARFIQVSHGNSDQSEIYALGLMGSSPQWLTREDLVKFIDSQSSATPLWQAVADKVSEAFKSNERPAVAAKDIRAYMLAQTGDEIMQYLLGPVLLALQSRAKLTGKPLEMGEFKKFFSDPEPADGAFDEETQMDFVSAPTPTELVSLINSQTAADRVWLALLNSLAMAGVITPEDTQRTPPDAVISEMAQEQFAHIQFGLVPQLQMLCHHIGVEFTVPTELQSKLKVRLEMLSPVERASFVPRREWLMPVENPVPWEFWCWHKIGQGPSFDTKDDISEVRAELRVALEQIKKFSTRLPTGAPFSDQFTLAQQMLEKPPTALLKADVAEEVMVNSIDSLPVQDPQKLALSRVLPALGPLSLLGYSEEALSLLLASTLADVFGGEGSWGDQMVEEADGQEFQQISTRLFVANIRAKLAAVNSTGNRLILFA
jgi:hypothetical protein